MSSRRSSDDGWVCPLVGRADLDFFHAGVGVGAGLEHRAIAQDRHPLMPERTAHG